MIFFQAGPLEHVHIPFDKVAKKKKNFGFVTFHHKCSVPYAIHMLNNIKMYGQYIKVDSRNSQGSLPHVEEVGIHSLDPDFVRQKHISSNSNVRMERFNSYPPSQANFANFQGMFQEHLVNLPNQAFYGDALMMNPMYGNNLPINDLRHKITSYDNQQYYNHHSERQSSYHNSGRNSNHEHFHRSHSERTYSRERNSNYEHSSRSYGERTRDRHTPYNRNSSSSGRNYADSDRALNDSDRAYRKNQDSEDKYSKNRDRYVSYDRDRSSNSYRNFHNDRSKSRR